MRIFQKIKTFLIEIVKKRPMKKRASFIRKSDQKKKEYKPFQKAVQALMLTICVVLFAVGGIWNVAQYFAGNPLLDEAIAYTEAMSKAEPVQSMQPADLDEMDDLIAEGATEKTQPDAKNSSEKTEKDTIEDLAGKTTDLTADNTKDEVPAEISKEIVEDKTDQKAEDVMAAAIQVNHQMAEATAVETAGGLNAILKGNVPATDKDSSYEEQIAALRIDKERSWAQKLEYLQALASNPESSTTLRTTAENQLMRGNEQRYLEQQLELLIKAKEFSDCLVVISDKQINVIVEEKEAKEGYLKLTDTILRNSNFLQEQIVILPL